MQNLPARYQNNQISPYQNADYIILPEAEESAERSIFDYIKIIRKRMLLFLLPMLLILPLVIFYAFSLRPVYEAKATLLIKQDADGILPVKRLAQNETVHDDYLNTQYEIIKSRPIAEIVVNNLRLHEKPPPKATSFEEKVEEVKNLLNTAVNSILSLLPGGEKPKTELVVVSSLSEAEQDRQKAITRMQETIEVVPRPSTQLIDIFLQSYSPYDAAEQINMVAKVYASQNLEDKLMQSREAIAWLENREANLREKISQAETSVQEIRKKDRILNHQSDDNDSRFSVEKLNRLKGSYIDISTKKDDLKLSIDELNSALQRGIDNITFSSFNAINSPALGAFIAERNTSKQEYLRLRRLFRSRHPKLIKAKSNLDQVSALLRSEVIKILNGLKREYQLLSSREANINQEIESQTLNIINSDDQLIKVNKINDNLNIEKELYKKVVTRLSEATLVKGLETNNIKIIEPATVPIAPISSGKIKSILLGMIVALSLGAGMAILADKFDKKFKSIDEVEAYLGLHFIGLIPSHKMKSNKPVTLYDPYTDTSEAFRFIRTWLANSAPGNPKKVLITSALPSEGKSHTATNLSISFAQLGYSVVLIDCDLRRPKIHQNLNLSMDKGLVDILAHNASWQTVVQDSDLENLRIITAGGVPHNPAELLSTERMRKLLDDLDQAFDIVIIDAPVTLSIPDVLILAPHSDGVLLVLGCPKTPFFGQILCPVFGPGHITLECPRLLGFGLGHGGPKSGQGRWAVLDGLC